MYSPSDGTKRILDRAMEHVLSVPYTVTARWVFYRLLQEGILKGKYDYKPLLRCLSRARKGFYKDWRPYTLTDDTRAADVRGIGFSDSQGWLEAVKEHTECHLDRWFSQSVYLEVWFEAAAMKAQFEHYINENVTLLAFHGDISIPEKWKAAERISRKWSDTPKPTQILYFGDLDPKGIQIPESAKNDIVYFIALLLGDEFKEFHEGFTFTRVGINEEHPELYGIPENPERPRTYQWEGLSDIGARELIMVSEDYLDMWAFNEVMRGEVDTTEKFRRHLDGLEV